MLMLSCTVIFFSPLIYLKIPIVSGTKNSAIAKHTNLLSPPCLTNLKCDSLLQGWGMWRVGSTRTSVSAPVRWAGNVHFYCTLGEEISLDSCDLKAILFPVQTPGLKQCSLYPQGSEHKAAASATSFLMGRSRKRVYGRGPRDCCKRKRV